MEAKKSKHGSIHLLRMEGGITWQKILEMAGSYAEEQGLAKRGFVSALLNREEHYPTGINAATGVAIPHADLEFTNRASMVVMILDTPVMFRMMGGGDAEVPVEIIFMLLMQDSGKHLDLLSAIVNFIQEKEKTGLLKTELAIDIFSERIEAFFRSQADNTVG